ncbi:hypothetical protein GKE82_23535 [Conexibacter sp. W3-3-2]|uniref:hypothetical protein n=1 Tax=Conexibacter sp. W3-3-2 TaxID=2675227 RepID=UPI0012B73246|nr:hypothetical protein [Conexibacter sp. W3-3-2]MTD47178.1 hypothetical protein [Conexibacter sp. W3-3-2]
MTTLAPTTATPPTLSDQLARLGHGAHLGLAALPAPSRQGEVLGSRLALLRRLRPPAELAVTSSDAPDIVRRVIVSVRRLDGATAINLDNDRHLRIQVPLARDLVLLDHHTFGWIYPSGGWRIWRFVYDSRTEVPIYKRPYHRRTPQELALERARKARRAASPGPWY